MQRIFDQAEKSSKLQWAQLVMEKDSKVTFNKIGANSLKDMKNGKSRLGVTFPRFDSTGAPIPNSEKCMENLKEKGVCGGVKLF